MRGIVLAVAVCLTFYFLAGLAFALSQHSEMGARYMALVLLPCAVVAVTAHRAGRRRV